MSNTISQMLGSYAYNFGYASLPPEAIAKAKTLLMHDMGVGMAGHTGETPKIAANAASRIYGSAGEDAVTATSFVLNKKVPLAHAVFANAALFHYRTQEDTHLGALAHFGPNIIPICLALGESLNKSGQEIIEAMVAGYQVGAAVGSVSAKESTARGHRASSIYGAFGGAVAGGKLLGLNEKQMQNAVALAANFGMGLNETWVAGTMEYAIQVGMTAVNGLMAATLAKEGMEAAETALEGRSGFYRAYAGMEDVRELVEEALSVKYQIYAVTMKYYCCCALTQSPVTAALNLLGKQPLKPEEIRHVNIRMNAGEAVYPGTMEKGPFRKFGGSLMSAPYCTAAALKFGTITMEGMTSFDDPVLNELIANSDVIPDEKVAPLSCVIEIETKDGRTLTETLNVGTEFFDFSFQQDVEILRDMLPEMKFDKGQFEQLVEYVSQFETLKNVAVVAGHLGEPGRA